MEPTADRQFETRLEAMFADPPEAPDADAFVQALERRLTQERSRRRMVLGISAAAGAAGAAAVFAMGRIVGGPMRLQVPEMPDLSAMATVAPLAAGALLLLALVELSPANWRR